MSGKRVRWKDGRAAGAWDDSTREAEETTVVLTGLPKTLTARIILDFLDQYYLGCYDYFYLPIGEGTLTNAGIAYINFRHHDKAVECKQWFAGFNGWPNGHFSERRCQTDWSCIQGYEANIQMQQKQKRDWKNLNIPEDFKPMVFDQYGCSLSFDAASEFSDLGEKQWYGRSGDGQCIGNRSSCMESRGWDAFDSKGCPEEHAALNSENVEATMDDDLDSKGCPEEHAALNSENVEATMDDDLNIQEVASAGYGKKYPQLIESLGNPQYACIGCGEYFHKWLACQHHIMSNPRCGYDIFKATPSSRVGTSGYVISLGGVKPDQGELQKKCREKASTMLARRQDTTVKSAVFDHPNRGWTHFQ